MSTSLLVSTGAVSCYPTSMYFMNIGHHLSKLSMTGKSVSFYETPCILSIPIFPWGCTEFTDNLPSITGFPRFLRFVHVTSFEALPPVTFWPPNLRAMMRDLIRTAVTSAVKKIWAKCMHTKHKLHWLMTISRYSPCTSCNGSSFLTVAVHLTR